MAVKKFKVLFVVLATTFAGLSAQGYNDAVIEYNKGVANFNTNIDSAIIYFSNCIQICEQAGDTALEIKMKAVQVLPDLCYQKAYNILSIDKKIDESIAASKEAMKIAEKYENSSAIEKNQRLLVQAYSSMGAKFFSSGEFDKALNAFDSVLMISPDHNKSVYNKALVYKKQEDTKNFGETIDLFLSKIDTVNDADDVKQANKLALDYFRLAGARANKAKNTDEAFELLTRAYKYGVDENLCYQMASVLNKQNKFAEAAENAQKGLDLSDDPAEKKAKYYYELGVAQAGLGETDKACESFKNSMFGPFVTASKAQRTNLKCK